MSKYLITLTPTGKFFFGGDMTFSSGNKKFDEKFSSYIIHSSKMPQQTSLLGMLRFLLLSNDHEIFDVSQNHIRKECLERAEELIGKQSFAISDRHEEGVFGCIQRIGPCFLYEKTKGISYFKSAIDLELNVNFDSCFSSKINGMEVDIPTIRMIGKEANNFYSGKENLQSYYISADKKNRKKEDELFIQDAQVGIDKDYKGIVKNAAFYKQISYRLKDNFCFAFEAEVGNVNIMSYDGQLVTVGADSSSFVLNVKKMEHMSYMESENECRVTLMSDSYLTEKELASVRYAITSIRPFRFLKTVNSEDITKYNIVHQTLRCNERYDLYQAGSVFYFRESVDAEAFRTALNSFKEFRQIGYNSYY